MFLTCDQIKLSHKKQQYQLGPGGRDIASPRRDNVNGDPEPSPSFVQFVLKGQTTLYLFFCPLPELGPSAQHGILTVVQETHPETWSAGCQQVKTWAVGVSFVQHEWFLAGVRGSHSGHSDQIAITDGAVWVPRETAPIGGSDWGRRQTCT